MRTFWACAEGEGFRFERPRLRVQARMRPVRFFGAWREDAKLLRDPKWGGFLRKRLPLSERRGMQRYLGHSGRVRGDYLWRLIRWPIRRDP